LLEHAFDEVLARGRPGFAGEKAPLQRSPCDTVAALVAEANGLLDVGLTFEAAAMAQRAIGAQPADPSARELLRRVLSAQARCARLSDSLLAMVERQSTNPALWFSLGQAFIGAGNRQDALKALEISLKLDANNLEGWLCLSELARETGNTSMLAEIADIAQRIAPGDYRVEALLQRTPSL
jgi:predicted Zn-dependent protease